MRRRRRGAAERRCQRDAGNSWAAVTSTSAALLLPQAPMGPQKRWVSVSAARSVYMRAITLDLRVQGC